MYDFIGFIILLLCKEISGNIGSTTANVNFNKRAIISDSCYGRCGQEIELPCSCDVKCSVYKTCCEDMEQYCSHIKQESLRKFHNLLNVDTECTVNDYLLISGCSTEPQDSHKSLDPLSKETRDFITVTPTHWQGNAVFNRILNGVPVTDSSTGLCFKNVSVFMCNGGNHSHMIRWTICSNYMDLNFNDDSSSTLDLHFTPPSNVNSVARCVSNSVGECEPNSDEDITAKCLAFRSYVTHFFISTTEFYNNKYCAQCNGYNNSEELTPVESFSGKHNFNFKIISSFVGNTIKFTSLNESNVSWSHLQCVLTELKEVVAFPDSYKCELMDCKTGFHKRPDGQCKELHVLRLALSTRDFSLDLGEYQKLTCVLQFLLTTYTKLETIGQWKPFRMRYDPRLNLELMITELVLYLTQESSRDFAVDRTIHVKTLTLLVKKIGHLNTILHWPHQRTLDETRFETIETVEAFSNLDKEWDQIINQSKVSVCHCFVPFTQVGFLEDADCTLKCIHLDEFRSDDYNEDYEELRKTCRVFNKSNGPSYAGLYVGIIWSYLMNTLFIR